MAPYGHRNDETLHTERIPHSVYNQIHFNSRSKEPQAGQRANVATGIARSVRLDRAKARTTNLQGA
jgi:hypothetical protein